MATPTDETLKRLSILLQLSRRARKASEDELGFCIVNETRVLISYRQAALFTWVDGSLKVAAVSGLAVLDASSPFIQWLTNLAARRLADGSAWTGAAVTSADCGAEGALLRDAWAEWLPREGYWLPLLGPQDRPQGVLALFREEAWSAPEQHVLSYLADSYGQALAALSPPPHKAWFGKVRRRWKIIAAALLLLSLYPMQESALAPAEVTASRPQLVRSALDGVVSHLTVQPNQEVKKGQELARLDDAQLSSRLAVAQKTLEMARAEYSQLLQLALASPEAKARLPLLKGRIDQLGAEALYVEDLLRRTVIVSQSDGVAVFDDPNAWLGRPVALGEKIMLVADPAQVELTILLPMNETLPVQQGGEALFFPNTSPSSPKRVTLSHVSYQASEPVSDSLAFTLRGDFEDKSELPRLGTRGTAKVYGPRMSLIAIALRHPVRAARQWLGW